MRTILGLGLVVLASCGSKEDRGGGGSRGSGDVIEVHAAILFSDYHQGNVAAADAKYLNKTLRVSGRVLKIEPAGSGYAVGLDTGPNVMPSGQVLRAAVVAEVSSAERDAVARLKEFDNVVVEGRCKGRKDSPGRMGGILILIANASIRDRK